MVRPINRATKFADAEVVVVLPDNLDPSALRPQWIITAIAALKAHEVHAATHTSDQTVIALSYFATYPLCHTTSPPKFRAWVPKCR
jgi:hypothetical protein